MHQFLKEDVKKAYATKGQALEQSFQFTENLSNDDFYKAEKNLLDALQLINILKQLQDKKKKSDRDTAAKEFLSNVGITLVHLKGQQHE